MALHEIRKGLELPISGAPGRTVEIAPAPRRVAFLAADFPGLKPQLRVQVGDAVRRGQVLLEDKRLPGVRHTAAASGKVVAIHRGERRALQSVVIELDAAERGGNPGPDAFQSFAAFTGKVPAALSRDEVQALLLESGLWTAFRMRPFGRVPKPGSVPRSIFVTAIETDPLGADVDAALAGDEAHFRTGLSCIRLLSVGKTYLCRKAGSKTGDPCPEGITIEEFSGPHPAGLPGLHIHILDPVCRGKTVWHLSAADVAAIGNLFATGQIDPARVVALGGPQAKNPRLLRTRLGASLDDILAGELKEGENRVVSGSVLSGRAASGDVTGFLGRRHLQVSVLCEDRERKFMGWAAPGARTFSVLPLFFSSLFPGRRFDMTTSANGAPRAIVPIGLYERVFPFDIIPTYLFRSLAAKDDETAEALGCLELDEEDVALCSFVCPGESDFGAWLRQSLDRIEGEEEGE